MLLAPLGLVAFLILALAPFEFLVEHKDPHGFAVDELKLQVVVDGASTKEVTVRPTRTGTFRLYCHLHAAHIGGQIVVNP